MSEPRPQVQPMIAGLLNADAYPHAIVTPVRVIETHISWVLLTGPYAYKIKKPLRLSFLDYSSLVRRRTCCEEELRLNRRYAPDLYLGLASVRGAAAAPRVDLDDSGEGEAIEYAVRMRQFDPRDELNALLAGHDVAGPEMVALGALVAGFHAKAITVDPAQPYGRADVVRRVILDNFGELRRLPEAAAWTGDLATLEHWVEQTHLRLGSLIEARRTAGRVRECHGDLHCGNVVRWQGALTPFDGIEFEPALRFVDVMNDLAFLTMDLAAHGRRDLRSAVLQAWTQSLGDFGGLPLLPLFEVYRALVRAKVAALRALQEAAGSPERARDCASAAAYLQWAMARTREAPPSLALTCGLSGSGKTTLARALAERLGWLHVRSDVERKRLAGLGPLEDSRSPPDAGLYTRECTQRTYERLLECAEHALRGGESILVDAAFLKRDERRRMLELARHLRVPAAVLHCAAPVAVLRERVAERAQSRRDASEAGLDVLARQPGFWEEFDVDERAHVVSADTTAPDAVEAALCSLRERGVA